MSPFSRWIERESGRGFVPGVVCVSFALAKGRRWQDVHWGTVPVRERVQSYSSLRHQELLCVGGGGGGGGSSMKISYVRERIKHVATTCKCVCTYCHVFSRKGKSVLHVCARGFIFARQEKRRHRDVQ